MATSGTLLSSTRWTSEQPGIYVSATYETKNRTSTSVDVRVIVRISAITGGAYFGYNIRSSIAFPGLTTSEATIKNNLPSQWSSPYTYDFGWHTIDQPASSRSFTATVNMRSNSGKRDTSYSGTVTIDIGNTAPYWPSNATARFNSTNNAITVAENVSSVNYSWSAATDDEQNTILYRTEWFKNGVFQGTWKDDVTDRSFSVDPSVIGEGQNMFFRVYCRDSMTSYGSYKQSNTLTRNLLIPAQISTEDTIRFDTTHIEIVRSTPSNLNGNTSFSYTLHCQEVTVYNASITADSTTIRVEIWRAGSYPNGPYIKFADIRALVSSSGYTGSLTFTLSTKNIYGSIKASSQKSVSVDLRVAPTTATISSVTGAYSIKGQEYFVIDHRPMQLSWTQALDQITGTSTGITYSVQASINNGAWATVASGLTSSMYTYTTRSIAAAQTIKFRVIAKTDYLMLSYSDESDSYTLHYYNPPVMSDLVVDRSIDRCKLSWKYKRDSSIPLILYDASFKVFDENDVLLDEKSKGSSTSGTNEYMVDSEFTIDNDTTEYAIRIECHDTIADQVFSIPKTELIGFVPRYSALLSIREKGIGINAVAGERVDFITKGTASHYGGDSDSEKDGALSFAVGKDSTHDFYIGCYRGADGELRAAYTTPKYTTKCFQQLQMAWKDGAAPLRYRWLFPSDGSSVSKDMPIEYENRKVSSTSWVNIPDASMTVPVGTSMEWNSSSIPSGYLLEDGRAISRITYSALFAVIGTTYGNGDGSTTFNLPNSAGRVAVSRSTDHTETNTLGKVFGSTTQTVPVPYHTHTQNGHSHTADHSHTASSGSAGSHAHQGLRWVDNGKCISLSSGGSGGSTVTGYQTGWSSSTVYSNAIKTVDAGSHSHAVYVSSASVTTSSTTPTIKYSGTSGATMSVFQPSIVKCKIIKY